MKVKIYPPKDFIYEFIQTRRYRLSIVQKKPDVLHYTGKSKRELLKLVKQDEPDLVVLNTTSLLDADSDINWVYNPVSKEQHFEKTKKIYTNAYSLAQIYYQRLGLQAEIKILPKRVPEEETKFNFVPQKFTTYLGRFKTFMQWA